MSMVASCLGRYSLGSDEQQRVPLQSLSHASLHPFIVGAAAVALMVFVMSVAVAHAELPQPYLTSVFPAGGQAGSSV